MEEIRARLVDMRNELRRAVASDVAVLSRAVDDKGEDSTPSQHPADVASDLYAREELVTEQVTLERELVEVDEALARIAGGTYGRCVDCGAEIATERLAARPQASRCIACQREADRRNPR
jgi:DnaK suppressor protein